MIYSKFLMKESLTFTIHCHSVLAGHGIYSYIYVYIYIYLHRPVHWNAWNMELNHPQNHMILRLKSRDTRFLYMFIYIYIYTHHIFMYLHSILVAHCKNGHFSTYLFQTAFKNMYGKGCVAFVLGSPVALGYLRVKFAHGRPPSIHIFENC